MKLRLLSALAVVVLVLALTFPAVAPAAPPVPNAKPAAAAAEPHPEIRDAIAALRNARFHLEHAAHDFGGHRVEALKATDEAIHQLEICLKYDK